MEQVTKKKTTAERLENLNKEITNIEGKIAYLQSILVSKKLSQAKLTKKVKIEG